MTTEITSPDTRNVFTSSYGNKVQNLKGYQPYSTVFGTLATKKVDIVKTFLVGEICRGVVDKSSQTFFWLAGFVNRASEDMDLSVALRKKTALRALQFEALDRGRLS